jgi:tetratricopeptide (TPR) repeat protein
MTQPDAPPPVPQAKTTGSTNADDKSESAAVDQEAGVAGESQPPPLPWTPERVSEWNAYYDIYVMLAVLLLTFVASTVKVDERNPVLWTHLRAGELMAQQVSPVLADSFSYTETGARWINVPWLFQWSHAAIYKMARDLVPTDSRDPTVNQASADQIPIQALVALAALARLITAWILLKIRRPGPGLWWSALCVALALGVIVGPFGVLPGGIAGPGLVTPSTWGLLLLSIEMLLLHRAYNEGRSRALYALAPVFLVWANLDETFFLGLVILAAAVLGRILDGQSAEFLVGPSEAPDPEGVSPGKTTSTTRQPVSTTAGLVVLALSIAACLANPSTYRVFLAGASPILQLFGPESELIRPGEISYFGKQIQKLYESDWHWFTVFYLVMVTLGLASFLLNARRFAWSRFLPFAVAATMWGGFMGFRQEYSVVFATVLTLNGQEWYHDRFGVRGRPGTGWTLWSTGGRLVTLGGLFFCVGVAITGWLKLPGQPRFGLTFEPGDFAFEAADYLALREDIQGNIFNTTAAQGDALIWKAFPARRTFYDGRSHVFSREMLEKQRVLRLALRDDQTEVWKPELDRYGITTVMIDSEGTSKTYERLTQSRNWIPFYDDGRVLMFGRADAPEPDLTAFKSNRLDPELRAYRVTQPIPSADRPPTPTSWIDGIFRNRLLGPAQPHIGAAARWLQGASLDDSQPGFPDPARCLLAIREARTALAKNPDDWFAYRLLDVAYRVLTLQETALLSGIPLTTSNRMRISQLVPNIDVLSTRFRQRVAALSYAIQTTPPPQTLEARRELFSLNHELFQLFAQAGYVDLARDRLQMALDQIQEGELTAEARAAYQQQLDGLTQRVKQIEESLFDLQTERQAGPIEKALYARNQGAPGLALSELEEADRGNMSPMVVKPQLVDLYCSTGQPDRALEMISMGINEDTTLGTEPGSSWVRQGHIYLLLGNYVSAASLWRERAIPRLRYERTLRALSAAQVLDRGELIPAINAKLTQPTLMNRQGVWEYELGQCLLESGSPEEAAEYFTRALKLVPDLVYRPIMAYYLTKMGKPVPELPGKAEPRPSKPMSPVDRLLRGAESLAPSPASVGSIASPLAPAEPARAGAPAAAKEAAPVPSTKIDAEKKK